VRDTLNIAGLVALVPTRALLDQIAVIEQKAKEDLLQECKKITDAAKRRVCEESVRKDPVQTSFSTIYARRHHCKESQKWRSLSDKLGMENQRIHGYYGSFPKHVQEITKLIRVGVERFLAKNFPRINYILDELANSEVLISGGKAKDQMTHMDSDFH
jgi:hypothetical protein